ncbi:MAG: hypothetical protein ACXVZ2_01060 [Gaiellaceae bacterium]
MRRALMLLLALGAALALVPAAARADGDPASDVLYNGKVFLPFEVKISGQKQLDLQQTAAAAWKAGYPIKVAVISSRYDLGSVGALWQKPQLYSKFLGSELAFLYKGRLLIVMPNGFGLNRGTVAERKLLKTVPIGKGADGMTATAADAVRELAAASGHALPKPAPKTSNAGRDRIVLIIAVVLIALLIVLFVPGVRRRVWGARAS